MNVLRVGKMYRDRDGHTTKIVHHNECLPYPFVDEEGRLYYENGDIFSTQLEDRRDLMEEVTNLNQSSIRIYR